MFFSPHPRGEKKMDLFIWLCGCLLAFLSPSAAKAEEGGEFDTFFAVTRRCWMGMKPLLLKERLPKPHHKPVKRRDLGVSLRKTGASPSNHNALRL